MSALPTGWRIAREPLTDLQRLMCGEIFVATVFSSGSKSWTARLVRPNRKWAWEAPTRRDVVDQAVERYNRLTCRN